MTSAFSLILLGFLLGIRHAVDPDHVVAVGTMATRSSSFRHSAGLGALWGAGHTLTVMSVGGAIVVLRTALAPQVALAMEFAVAFMLIVLGLLNIIGARGDVRPSSNVRPLVVGMVHGMAGSAAIALLVLATIRDSTLGLIYLLCFGVGTMAGMVAVTALLVLPLAVLVGKAGLSRRWLTAASGLVSVGVGMLLAHSLGGTAALLATATSYTPR